MASMQCYKPSNETCQQKCHENSLGQKVPEIASHVLVLKGKNQGSETSSQTYCQSQTEIQAQYKSLSIIPEHTTSKTQTQCYSQTQTKQVDQGLEKDQSTQCTSQTHTSQKKGHHGKHHATNGMTCEGNTKKRGEHKKKERRNLLQKIKDGLSGHSSDSSSSSSSSSESESDNDNCKCEKKKN